MHFPEVVGMKKNGQSDEEIIQSCTLVNDVYGATLLLVTVQSDSPYYAEN